MIIMKKAMSRRTVLKSARAVLALPLLDAMIPAATAWAKTPARPVRRLGFVYMPMGCDHPRWDPPAAETLTELSPILQSLVPLRYRGLPAKRRRELIEEALAVVGLTARLKHYPAQLSGGQQQRVAVARALVGTPRLILADEPTGNLDSAMANEILDLLERINGAGTTVVMVTHDPELATRAPRQIHVLDGRMLDLAAESPAPLFRPGAAVGEPAFRR